MEDSLKQLNSNYRFAAYNARHSMRRKKIWSNQKYTFVFPIDKNIFNAYWHRPTYYCYGIAGKEIILIFDQNSHQINAYHIKQINYSSRIISNEDENFYFKPNTDSNSITVWCNDLLLKWTVFVIRSLVVISKLIRQHSLSERDCGFGFSI